MHLRRPVSRGLFVGGLCAGCLLAPGAVPGGRAEEQPARVDPVAQPAAAPAADPVPGAAFRAADTLATGDEPRPDARQCLGGLCWEPEEFSVTVAEAVGDDGDLRVRFPSPFTDGPDCTDTVWMEWYRARDAAGAVTDGPACVVVHESGSGMRVGRLIARGLSAHGIHAFMLQMPFYGERRPPRGRAGVERLIPVVRQAVADVRRARDAVAVLPTVDAARIAVQGLSLGGFVTATAAGLDAGYDKVFILLAGGDLAGVLEKGKRDAEKVRQKLAASGLSEAEVQEALHAVEPTRLAHRYRPDRTWLYSGKYDDVVPLAHGVLLAEAAGLPAGHHVQLDADHYTGIIYLPLVLAQIAGEIHGRPAAGPRASRTPASAAPAAILPPAIPP